MEIGSFLLVLLSPALLPISLLFPFYWIGQYRLLRTTGSWALHREHHDVWMRRLGKAGLCGAIVCLLAFLRPGLLPGVAGFLGAGGFLLLALPVAVDVALVMALSPDRAFERWNEERAERTERLRDLR